MKRPSSVWGEWIEANRSAGRKDPLPQPKQLGHSKTIGKLIPDYEERKLIFERYLKDTDKFLASQGWPLCLLLGRIEAYRNQNTQCFCETFEMLWERWTKARRKIGLTDPARSPDDAHVFSEMSAECKTGREFSKAFQAYLDDKEEWLEGKGHPLKYLPGRMNKYTEKIHEGRIDEEKEKTETLFDTGTIPY